MKYNDLQTSVFSLTFRDKEQSSMYPSAALRLKLCSKIISARLTTPYGLKDLYMFTHSDRSIRLHRNV